MAVTNKKASTKKTTDKKTLKKEIKPKAAVANKKITKKKKTTTKATKATKTNLKSSKKVSINKETLQKTKNIKKAKVKTSKQRTSINNKKEYKIAGVFDRYLAKGLDLIVISFIAFIISHISGILAFIVAVTYALFIDAKPEWSLGKGAINLRVLGQETNEPISFKQSALRNSPIAILVALSLIPLFGWILMMIIAIPVLVLEAYLLYNLENHHRLGDIIADTKVVEVESSRKK